MTSNQESESSEAAASKRRYRRAGLIYFALAMVIVILTVVDPALAAPERRTDIIHLLVGLPFIAGFALLVAYGDIALAAPVRWFGVVPDKARRIGAWLHEKLTMLLTLSSLGRTLFYISNGVGLRPRLRPPFEIETVEANPKMLIAAVIMTVILVTLARASWVPFIRRLRQR